MKMISAFVGIPLSYSMFFQGFLVFLIVFIALIRLFAAAISLISKRCEFISLTASYQMTDVLPWIVRMPSDHVRNHKAQML